MSLKDFLQRRMQKAKMLKDAQEQLRVSKTVEQRTKTPNERDLEDFLEKERQKKIKVELQGFRDKERREMFSGGLNAEKNVFKGHKNILAGKKLFPIKQSIHGGNMFFK